MYRLFYNYKVTGDVLLIELWPGERVDKVVFADDVAACYGRERLVGVNIFDFSKIVKLKTSGMIVTPKDELIDVVNTVLAGAGLPPLEHCLDSGYKVAEIIALEEHPLDEKAKIVTLGLGGRKLNTVSWYGNLEVGSFVVVALEGTITYDGSMFHAFTSRNIPNDAAICSAKELKIVSEAPGAFLVNGYQPGEDFYLGGH